MENNSPSYIRYSRLNTYKDLQRLIIEGESEDLFYECKSPASPVFSKEMKVYLARAMSGFSNAEGGVIIYGMVTQKSSQTTKTDVMIQITKIGSIADFAKTISNAIPTITVPSVTNFQYKIIKQKTKDSAGVLVLYIPRSNKPVQSSNDNVFHIRGGDQFVTASYTTIERLFSTTNVPEVEAILTGHQITDIDGKVAHQFDITLKNNSMALGKNVAVYFEVLDHENATSSIKLDFFNDVSKLNDDRKVFCRNLTDIVHYKLGLVIGTLNVVMKEKKQKLSIKITTYAENMLPRTYRVTSIMSKKSLLKQESKFTQNE